MILLALTPPWKNYVIFGTISLLVVIILALVIKVALERKKVSELKAAGLANFQEGNADLIDPNGFLDEQADLLPYKQEYEFPRENLQLGKVLGSGAFGTVVEAVAEGILPHEEKTLTAVKMLKKMANNEVMRSLVIELKIMIHLGQHVNVLTLLGAVTKNIAMRELLVIVEHCAYGSLEKFLIKNRDNFVDEIRDDEIVPNEKYKKKLHETEEIGERFEAIIRLN